MPQLLLASQRHLKVGAITILSLQGERKDTLVEGHMLIHVVFLFTRSADYSLHYTKWETEAWRDLSCLQLASGRARV